MDETGVFRCEFCHPEAAVYSSYRALKIHMAVHKRFFKCPLCEEGSCSKYELKLHFRFHFTRQSDSEEAWKEYMVNKPKPASEAVGRSTPRASRKQKSNVVDRQSSDDNGDPEFELSDSENDFQSGTPSVDPIPQHTVSVNSENDPNPTPSTSERAKFQCDICYKVLSSARNVMNHMLIHSGELPHQCEICQQRFRLAQNLKRHQKQHLATTTPQCPFCTMTFQRQSDIKRHLPWHYNTKEEVDEVWEWYIGTMEQSDPNTEAPECGETIDQNSEDIQEKEEPEDVVPKFQCNICEKKLSSARILKRHMSIHTEEKPFQCDICQATFRQNFQLQSHRRIHFVNSEIFKCPHCDVTACHRHNLKRHFLKVHFKSKKSADEEWKKYTDSFKCKKVVQDQKVVEDSDEETLEDPDEQSLEDPDEETLEDSDEEIDVVNLVPDRILRKRPLLTRDEFDDHSGAPVKKARINEETEALASPNQGPSCHFFLPSALIPPSTLFARKAAKYHPEPSTSTK